MRTCKLHNNGVIRLGLHMNLGTHASACAARRCLQGSLVSLLKGRCLVLQGHLCQLADEAGVSGSTSSFCCSTTQQSHAEHPRMQHSPAGAHWNSHKRILVMTSAASLTVKCPAPTIHGGFCVDLLHVQEALHESARGDPVCLPINSCSCVVPGQVVSSFGDGNTMGPHIIGDMVCLLLALAQTPWLCGAMSSLWGRASCTVWLVTHVRHFAIPDAYGMCWFVALPLRRHGSKALGLPLLSCCN